MHVGNVGEGVRDGESTEAGWNSGEDVDMGECVGVIQGMGDEVAVLAVVIHAAVWVVFACHQRSEQQSVMRVWLMSAWVC